MPATNITKEWWGWFRNDVILGFPNLRPQLLITPVTLHQILCQIWQLLRAHEARHVIKSYDTSQRQNCFMGDETQALQLAEGGGGRTRGLWVQVWACRTSPLLPLHYLASKCKILTTGIHAFPEAPASEQTVCSIKRYQRWSRHRDMFTKVCHKAWWPD